MESKFRLYSRNCNPSSETWSGRRSASWPIAMFSSSFSFQRREVVLNQWSPRPLPRPRPPRLLPLHPPLPPLPPRNPRPSSRSRSSSSLLIISRSRSKRSASTSSGLFSMRTSGFLRSVGNLGCAPSLHCGPAGQNPHK